MKQISKEEVQKHNKEGDNWIIIDGKVYDVSDFAEAHPGGKGIITSYAGKDVSDEFKVYHNSSVLAKYDSKLAIGVLPVKEEKRKYRPPKGCFGDMIPYGDPIWYQRFNSPYYKETHKVWREHVRNFVETEILPTVENWKDANEPPKDLYLKMGKAGLLAAMCGPPWPAAYLPSDVVAPKDFDYFHELIVYDEIARCGYSSVIAALTNGPAIGLPVILRFASEELKQRVVPDVLLGKKYISLAISEPQAGSDVAGMVTTAERKGDLYIVNGNKKWITNGTYAHYHVTAVRTGTRGQLSFLLVEDPFQGFSKRKLNIRSSDVSGTAYLDFDNCTVPASNLIGKENEGFKLVMYNFNHERFYISTLMNRLSRVCLEECIKYAVRRKAFGKPLSELQSIRMKIAAMTRMIESQQAWLEYITYQLCTMGHAEANEKIGDVISLLKAQGSKVYEHCARESTMIFGGNALYMGGVGRKVEVAVAQVKGYQIPAGAEDVMDDFAGRVAFKRLALANL
jgi:alkylation response protein AidB-like acyl-CoA dehydrogenase/predicted heme/steroid binding protein